MRHPRHPAACGRLRIGGPRPACAVPRPFQRGGFFSDDRNLSATFADLVNVKADIKAKEALAEALKQPLQQAMGDASEARFETGRVLFRRSQDSTTINTDLLLLNHPELVAEYVITKPGTRRFLIRN